MKYIILDSKNVDKSEDFTIEYSRPFHFTEIALQSFSMYISWNNITEKNNKFSYFDGAKWEDFIIPNGHYSIRGLNRYMVKYFGNDSPILFGIIEERQRFSIKLEKNYKIDLSKSELYKILGFEPKIYEEEEQEGKFIADIANGNDNIYIHCDIVDGAYINQFQSQVIYSFTSSNPPGSLYAKEFDKLIFFPVKSDSINRIRMRITNHRGELIDLNKQEVQYKFIAK